MANMRKLLGVLCIGGALAIAGCGTSTAPTASPRLGALLAEADQCSGPPGEPAYPVEVIVFRDRHVLVRQTKLGSHRFKSLLPPGRYRVTTNQSYAVPLNVEVRTGQVAHASIVLLAIEYGYAPLRRSVRGADGAWRPLTSSH